MENARGRRGRRRTIVLAASALAVTALAASGGASAAADGKADATAASAASSWTAANLTVALAPSLGGTIVQTIQTSAWSPSSPDPSGVVYVDRTDRLLVSDSEVEEMSFYAGTNLWRVTRTGEATATGSTLNWVFGDPSPTNRGSIEPAGLGYDPANDTMYVADDDRDRVYWARPGADGSHGSVNPIRTDDTWGRFDVAARGITDPEGVDYDVWTGDLFLCDGIGIEVYRIDAGANGVFGDADDATSHFDLAQFGARDCEGISSDDRFGTLLAIDPNTKTIYELALDGTLVRTIDLSWIPAANRSFASVALAPTSDPTDHPMRLNYWVADRQADNLQDPAENDGLIYEIEVPGADAAPSVALTAPAAGATVSGSVTVSASASDDLAVAQVEFFVDGTSVGADTNGADGWSVTLDTVPLPYGERTLSATATDSVGQVSSASQTIVVDNDDAPAAAVTAPDEGAKLRGVVSVAASASDDAGVTQVEFFVDGASIGVDASAGDGWSVAWNTAAFADGPRTLTATAMDARGQTGSGSRDVILDNTAPVASLTSPAAGVTISGTSSVAASASDADAVVSVEFFVGATSLGVDSNGADGWSISWNSKLTDNGSRVLTAVARDAVGNVGMSDPVTVTVDNPITTVVVPVAAGSDDGDERVGSVRLTESNLYLGMEKGRARIVGLRFLNVAVPNGATVVGAYVQFTVAAKHNGETTVVIRGEAADTTTTFTTATGSISSRPATIASVPWTIPSWSTAGAAGVAQRSADVRAVVNEIVARPGWTPGGSVVLVLTGTTGKREARSFEGRGAPVLHIQYK